MAKEIEYELYREQVLSEVAQALAQVGQVDRALAAAERIEHHQSIRLEMLSRVIQTLFWAGEVDRILQVTERIGEWSIRDDVLGEVSRALAQAGDEAKLRLSKYGFDSLGAPPKSITSSARS